MFNKSDELSTACEIYLYHLSQRIIKEMKNIKASNKPQYSLGISLDTNNQKMQGLRERHKTLSLACQKYEAVQELQLLIHDKARFVTKFNQHRNTIKMRNDTAGTTFLKMVSTILSLGVLTLFGLWKVDGRNFCHQVDDIVQNKDPDPMYDGL